MKKLKGIFINNFFISDLNKYYTEVAKKRFYNNIPNLVESLVNDESIVYNSDLICFHVFDLLGSGKRLLGKKINWHQDVKTGYIWPKLELIKMREHAYKHFDEGNDVRIPWELSRFYQLVPLSLAFYKTSNKKYVNEIENEILDWIKENPVGFGINWFNAMEASIRVCNWIFAFQIANIKLDMLGLRWSNYFVKNFLLSIVEHGDFIFNNLENYSPSTNHYIADLVGLLYIGLNFPEFQVSEIYTKRALVGLEAEIQNQVYDDGVDYELSISYHRFVTELFLYSSLLCMANGIFLTNKYFEKLNKMLQFIYFYTKPNGESPNMGDNDNSRLHIVFEDYYERYNSHLPTLQITEIALLNSSCAKGLSGRLSLIFENGGFCVMKNDRLYLITGRGLSCRSGLNNHTHNDILSFELSSKNNDFIVDSGTFVYTASLELRNKYRSTRMHNTLIIDDAEQNEFLSYFKMQNCANLRINKWLSTDKFDFLDFEHDGFMRLELPIKHNRLIFFDKIDNYFLVTDILTGSGKHKFEWNFHFAPNVSAHLCKKSAKARTSDELLEVTFPVNCYAAILEDETSPSYGTRLRSLVLRLEYYGEIETSKKFRFRFILK